MVLLLSICSFIDYKIRLMKKEHAVMY